MEFVFDELKQYIVKKVSYDNRNPIKYANVIKNKKYLIVYYHTDKETKQKTIKLIEYPGKFSNVNIPRGGPDSYFIEGYEFYGIYQENNNNLSLRQSYYITGEFNCDRTDGKLSHEFYELEDIFSSQNISNIYDHIVINNKLNDIQNTITIKISEISICICSIDIVDEINFDYASDDDNKLDNDN